ncbi:hypothetical protein HanXRQr2_Chr14g0621441 [Helianthus annuus]|uniref:Uncharacterized protein n=1 Tax=Helianthus annuus TaxID=4232 RepID=A0A9K3H5V6_HELAN|nr:hypothetical protein HanXRQr2_Chr14g0621441 [Helianthus annuus]
MRKWTTWLLLRITTIATFRSILRLRCSSQPQSPAVKRSFSGNAN